ncbi:MAG TPA: glycosyltransferase [Myxococcales bacterium]|nr:glycosyltransferase [Myxococcales bacterium]
MELWIAGFPSGYGGADTELDHLIDLLRAHDVGVHLVPMFGSDTEAARRAAARGCEIHEYRKDVFRGRVVASFCNGHFLERLPEIVRAGRPALVIWFNCMTFVFEAERRAHERGEIDLFGFISAYQESWLRPALERIRPVRTMRYRPYFNPRRADFLYREWNGEYRIGRISRDDGAKFAPDTWRIFDRVLVPPGLRKKTFILGYGPNAAAKIGPAPPGLDWRTWAGNEIPATQFFRTVDTMIHKTGGSRESYCRVLIEAWAHGVVPIVERDYAFPELVVDGESGFMASDSDEMSYRASWLAHHPGAHRKMAEAGRRRLLEIVDEEACWEGWREVLGGMRVAPALRAVP